MNWTPPADEAIPAQSASNYYAPAKATFYGNFEDKYGSQTAQPNPLTGQNQAQQGVTIAVDPSVIPYGSRVLVPQYARYSANGDGVFIAHDTGGDVKSKTASGGQSPVIDFYSNDAKTSADLDKLNGQYGSNINYHVLAPNETPAPVPTGYSPNAQIVQNTLGQPATPSLISMAGEQTPSQQTTGKTIGNILTSLSRSLTRDKALGSLFT